jgi:hypothetical protein
MAGPGAAGVASPKKQRLTVPVQLRFTPNRPIFSITFYQTREIFTFAGAPVAPPTPARGPTPKVKSSCAAIDPDSPDELNV